MITVHDIEQGSTEWFLLRCGSLGASRAKEAIAGGQGKSRKTLAYQLAAEKITGEKTVTHQTPAMLRGTEMEPEARRYFEFEKEVDVEEVGLVTNDKYPGRHASPDGLIDDDSGLEIKCPTAAVHAKYLVENRLPLEYKVQVFYSMWLCERKTWWFMSYHPLFLKQLILEVKWDEKYIAELHKKVDIFSTELAEIIKKIGA